MFCWSKSFSRVSPNPFLTQFSIIDWENMKCYFVTITSNSWAIMVSTSTAKPCTFVFLLLILVLCLLGRFKCLTSPFLSLLRLFFQLSISFHHHPVQHHLS